MTFIVLSDLRPGPPGSAVNGLDAAGRRAAARAIIRDQARADFVASAGGLADLGGA